MRSIQKLFYNSIKKTFIYRLTRLNILQKAFVVPHIYVADQGIKVWDKHMVWLFFSTIANSANAKNQKTILFIKYC